MHNVINLIEYSNTYLISLQQQTKNSSQNINLFCIALYFYYLVCSAIEYIVKCMQFFAYLFFISLLFAETPTRLQYYQLILLYSSSSKYIHLPIINPANPHAKKKDPGDIFNF